MKAKTRAALYARVSTSDGRQDPDNQLDVLRRFAQASKGYEIAGEYVDRESGKTGDRRQFRQLFHDAANGRFDVVVFWSLDRFSREGTFKTLERLNTLSGYGVRFVSYTEAYLDSCGAFGEAIIAVLAAIARQERLRLSERVKAGVERARKNGTAIGRPRKVVDTKRALALRTDGLSYAATAAKLSIGEGTLRRALKPLEGASEVRQKPSEDLS